MSTNEIILDNKHWCLKYRQEKETHSKHILIFDSGK